jgi:hypothetical protein
VTAPTYIGSYGQDLQDGHRTNLGHFAFLTALEGDPVEVDAFLRAHATVELAIKDLTENAGMEHVPSGNFNANAAWLVCAALAHNLIRWTARLGEITPDEQLLVARTIRTKFLSVPVDLSAPAADRLCVLHSDCRGPKPSNKHSISFGPFRQSPCSQSLAAGAPQTTEGRH